MEVCPKGRAPRGSRFQCLLDHVDETEGECHDILSQTLACHGQLTEVCPGGPRHRRERRQCLLDNVDLTEGACNDVLLAHKQSEMGIDEEAVVGSEDVHVPEDPCENQLLDSCPHTEDPMERAWCLRSNLEKTTGECHLGLSTWECGEELFQGLQECDEEFSFEECLENFEMPAACPAVALNDASHCKEDFSEFCSDENADCLLGLSKLSSNQQCRDDIKNVLTWLEESHEKSFTSHSAPPPAKRSCGKKHGKHGKRGYGSSHSDRHGPHKLPPFIVGMAGGVLLTMVSMFVVQKIRGPSHDYSSVSQEVYDA